MRRRLPVALIQAITAAFLTATLSAQVLVGSLVGTIQDADGLNVPGATVVIREANTNYERTVISNESGSYTFPSIPTGTYTVTVTLPGFATFTARDIVVRQNATVRVDAVLQVGGLQEGVEVTARAAVLQTESAMVQSTTSTQQLETLPTSGRSYQSMLTLVPGVYQPQYVQSGGINNPSRSMSISVNGQPPGNTVVRIDGVSATNPWFESLQTFTPGIEAIETVNITTSTMNADQGMAGASVNVQIKSGTNTLRGSAFDYVTSEKMRNRAYFLPATSKKLKDTRNIWGGTLGGPIVRNKLFYFASLEATFQDIVSSQTFLTLPSAELRRGNFAGTGTIIYDPATGAPNGTGRIAFATQNCPGVTSAADPRFNECNFIPASRLNPLAQRLIALQPLPQFPGTTNNYFATPTTKNKYAKIDTKFTYLPTARLHTNTRLGWVLNSERQTGLYAGTDGGNINPLSLPRHYTGNVSNVAFSSTAMVSPTLVVDTSVGFTRSHTQLAPDAPGGCQTEAVLGIPNGCAERDTSLALFGVTGYQAYGGGFGSQVYDYLDPQWQATTNATWVKGRHSIRFGADVHHIAMNHYEVNPPAGGPGTMSFGGGATALNGGPAPNQFHAFAQFLLGLASTRGNNRHGNILSSDPRVQERPLTLRSLRYGFYVQDSWEISRRLTASLGLRYEKYPMESRADRGLEIFDFATNVIRLCGLGDTPRDCGVDVANNLFTPRVGFAYRATDSVVLRAGYSRTPDNTMMGRFSTDTYPLRLSTSQNFGPISGTTFEPVGVIGDGFPAVPNPPQVAEGQILLLPGAGVRTLPQKYTRGVINSFNASVQANVFWGMVGQAGYVGNRQNNMVRIANQNYGTIGGGAASQPFNRPGLANGLRTTGDISVMTGDRDISYDSLQTSLNRRFANGFAMTAAYTYARAIDSFAGGILIPEFYHLNPGPSTFTGILGAGIGGTPPTPHKFDLSSTLDLPFGSGKKWANAGGIASALAGGWTVNTVFTSYTGRAFTVSANAASLNAPGNPQMADQVKDKVEIYGHQGPGQPYFDVTAFRSVTDARFGNQRPNSLRGPGVTNLDLSVFRSFQLRGRSALQLRVEIYNVTNTPHFNNPGSNVSNMVLNPDGTVFATNGFGEITSTNAAGREYDERYVRLGLRLSF